MVRLEQDTLSIHSKLIAAISGFEQPPLGHASTCNLKVTNKVLIERCSLEFMPGKQVGLADGCYPDSLIASIPNLYYYAANNPSEATIAKRRSYANTISCEPSPPSPERALRSGPHLGKLLCTLI